MVSDTPSPRNDIRTHQLVNNMIPAKFTSVVRIRSLDTIERFPIDGFWK